MLLATWEVLLELAPWLLLGAAVAGLLHGLLPAGFIERHLHGRGAVLRAVVFGVPMPLCSCGVIPAGLGLKQDGASDGAAIGFLVSTPQTGVDSILVSGALLGWPFALLKVGAAAVTGLVAGGLTERFGGPRVALSDARPAGEGTGGGLRAMLDHSLMLLQTIWRWVAFGVLASAAITAFIPADALPEFAGESALLAMLGALAISVPLYVCATASVPIAAALVTAGMPLSAALVFLMAGPATNVATIGAIHRGFGRRITAIYLGTVVVGSMLLGWGMSWVLADRPMGHVHEHGASLPAQIAAVALIGLTAWFAVTDVRRWWASRQPTDGAMTLAVEGMTCNGCVRRLERVLGGLDGVDEANVSLEPGQAVVRGTMQREAVEGAIVGAGFGVG